MRKVEGARKNRRTRRRRKKRKKQKELSRRRKNLHGSHGMKPFLSSSIPDLKFEVQVICFDFHIKEGSTNSGRLVMRETLVNESLADGGLSNITLPHKYNLHRMKRR
jgi:hypothetical protein